MRIYQCIHKYPAHIPFFEKRWGISDESTFEDIINALYLDGYASVYRLIPPLDRPGDHVFFTIWDYERLQQTWAREHGITTKDLEEIRLAQIALLKPDVVYDFSPFVSPSFAGSLRHLFSGPILAWNGFIKESVPPADPAYDGYVSLHRPFVESWKRRGFHALELQPGVDPVWGCIELRAIEERREDLILYGQLGSHFGKRTDLIRHVLLETASDCYRFKCYTQIAKRYYKPGACLARLGIDLPFLLRWPDKDLRRALSPPIFGIKLYETIRDAKAVLNNFTDLSVSFHSNMRIFEVIGNGTPLIMPNGVYPDGLVGGVDYFPFSSIDDVSRAVRFIISEPQAAHDFALTARERILRNFSKERQYIDFVNFALTL